MTAVVVVVAAVVEREGCFLVTRRPEGVHLAGYWEFPGGKRHEGESDVESLEREMREELDCAVSVDGEILVTRHAYPDRVVELRFYSCRLAGEPVPQIGQEMRWVPASDLRTLRFPPADADLIERLVARRP